MPTCPKCNGKGALACHSCDGKGNRYLAHTLGFWESDCSICYGLGTITCPRCEGRGTVQQAHLGYKPLRNNPAVAIG